MPLVAYLWIAFALNYVDRQMVYSMFPALQADLGFAGAKLGLIGSVFMWVYTFSMPVAGRVADLWRKEALVVASLVLWSLATVGCGTATSETSFLIWRGAMGVTEAMYYPAAMAIIAGHYAEGVRSRALGFHQSAMYVGVLAGGWYGGWAADHVGWRYGFLFAAVAGIGYSLVLGWGLRASKSEAVVPQTKPEAGSTLALFRSPCYVALSFAFAAFCAIQWVVLAWYPTFLQQRFHLSMTDSGWNATLFVQASQVLGIFLGGALADKLRKRWRAARLYVSAVGVFGSAPFAYGAFAATSLDEARLYSAGFGLLSGLLSANVFAAGFDVVGNTNRGLAGGVLNMMGGLSSAGMIYMAGVWRETIGFAQLIGWMTLASFSTAIVLCLVAAKHLRGLPSPGDSPVEG